MDNGWTVEVNNVVWIDMIAKSGADHGYVYGAQGGCGVDWEGHRIHLKLFFFTSH
jgi:hypothetical protein